jgi:hypothetical protein
VHLGKFEMVVGTAISKEKYPKLVPILDKRKSLLV